MTTPDLLAEVRAATDAKTEAEVRWLAACRAAYDAGEDRTGLARAAGFANRDGLYQLLRRHPREQVEALDARDTR